MLGAGVSNEGLIQARMGNLVLASGNKFTLDFYGDTLINFTIDEATTNAGVDQYGNRLKAGVSNTGKILADGGMILVAARVAQGVLDNAINMEGVALARSVSERQGVIILSSEEAGTVSVGGEMSVASHDSQAGKIKVLGQDIQLKSSAVLEASGATGGGTILIGGAAHGAGPEQNADYTYVAPGASIIANARINGNGGNIIVWSNKGTRFYGSISAQGGVEGGSGGWVETSGRDFLDVSGGSVNTLAPFGKTGTWLLDPSNIYIVLNQANATAAGMSGTDTSANTSTGTNPQTFAAVGAILDSLLTTGNLTTALGTSNVIVTTTNASGTGLGNITVVDPFSWVSANTLTLTAANNILLNAAITTGAAGSALILNASGSVTQTAGVGGSGGLTQQGTGTATLSQANTYSGLTTVNAGALTLSDSGTALNSSGFIVNQGGVLTLDNTATNLTNRITSGLTLNSGEFVFKGTNIAATNASETLGALNLASGYSTITAISGTGGSTTLTFDSITHSGGATALFRGDNLGGTPGAGVSNIMFITPTGLNLTGANKSQFNKPIVPNAIGDTSSTGSGIGFVTYNINPSNNDENTTGIRPLNLASEYTAATGTTGVNLKLDAASVSPDANRTFNSILFSGGYTYTIGSSGGGSRTLTVTSGAIFSNAGATNTITGRAVDRLRLGAVEGNFFTLGDLTLGTSHFEGTRGLTKSGSGVLLENASAEISGGITINSGVLRLGIANAFATAQPLTIRAPGTFDLNNFNNSITTLTLESGSTSGANITSGTGTLTLGGDVTLNAVGSGATGAIISGNLALGANRLFTVNDGDGSNDLSISALVSGPFNLTKAGTGTLNLSGANTYSGTTTVSAGTLRLGAITGLGNTTSATVSNNATLDIAFNSGTLANTNRIYLNGIGVNDAGALTMSGSNAILNNPITLSSSSTIGGSGTGVLTLGGAITGTGTNLTINLANAGVSLPATTLTTSGNLSVTTGGPITQTGILTIPGTSSFSAGSNAITLTQSNALTGAVTLSNTGSNDVNLRTSGALQLAASSIGRDFTAISGGAITLNGIIAAGNSITLSGTRFINNAGALGLSPGTGDFRVWTVNPASDTRGVLAYNFKQYNATYGVTPVQGIGSGFLYTIAPTIIPSLTGSVSKTYTGTAAATLDASNYSFTGAIDSDVITLNNPTSGTYASVNVGTNINVSVSGITILSATDGSATVYGYQINPTTANANIGTIIPASVVAPSPETTPIIIPANPIIPKTLVVDVVNQTLQAESTQGVNLPESSPLSIQINEPPLEVEAQIRAEASKTSLARGSLLAPILENFEINTKATAQVGIPLPTMQNIVVSESQSRGAMPFGSKGTATYEQNSTSIWDINFIILVLGVSVLFVLVFVIMLWMITIFVTRRTSILADSLSKVNADNYTKMTNHSSEGVSMQSSHDIVKLLPNGLPAGYRIVFVPVPQNEHVACVVIGPMDTRALFTVTGTSPNTVSIA